MPKYFSKSFFTFYLRFIFIVTALNIITAAFSFTENQEVKYETQYLKKDVYFESRPNVYVIMTDGYPSSEQTRKHLNFDNSAFLSFLEFHGFSVLKDTHSNYPITFLSLLSTFNVSYPFEEGPSKYNMVDIFKVIGGKNRVFNVFRDNKYTLLHFENGAWDGTNCQNQHAQCYKKLPFSEKEYPTLSRLSSFFHFELITSYLNNTPLAFVNSYFNEHIVLTLEELTSRLKQVDPQKPFFLFAHMLPPHPPLIFNPDCSIKRSFKSKQLGGSRDKKGFKDNLLCANHQLSHFVEYISEFDPNAIVIIFSDHGTEFTTRWTTHPKNWTEEEIRERYKNLIAIKAPGHCKKYFYPVKSNINIFPSLFSCLSDKKLPYAPDRVFSTTYETEKYAKIFAEHSVDSLSPKG